MRFSSGGRLFEAIAGSGRGGASRAEVGWRTRRAGLDPWSGERGAGDQEWLRTPAASAARELLQQGGLFPLTRFVARPRVTGASDLEHAPQPAVIAANHSSDIDTPLVLAGLPYAWRRRTVVGAAEDRFYRRRRHAVLGGLWINTFPFDRSGELRGLARAAEHLRAGRNVLLYPQGTRSQGLDNFRTGVARLCLTSDVPLIPVHLGGTALIMPRDRGLIQRGNASVSFGRPIYPEPGEQIDAFVTRTSAAIGDLAGGRR